MKSVRMLLGATALVVGALFGVSGLSAQDGPPTTRAGGYREAALDAAKWIRSTAVVTEKGTAWPAVPGDAKTVDTGIYHGVSGIVLFFLEAHRATGEATYLKDA